MAMAWDHASNVVISMFQLRQSPFRLKLPMNGSGASSRHLLSSTPSILETLASYDDATAATHVRQPLHCACALFHPTVPPAGQFAIYNALKGPGALFVLTAGHCPYPEEHQESQPMLREVYDIFLQVDLNGAPGPKREPGYTVGGAAAQSLLVFGHAGATVFVFRQRGTILRIRDLRLTEVLRRTGTGIPSTLLRRRESTRKASTADGHIPPDASNGTGNTRNTSSTKSSRS